MASVALSGRGGENPGAMRGAAAYVREAFDALLAGAPRARPLPGGLAPLRVTGAAREGWLEGLREALAELPVLAFGVTPGAVLFGDVAVLDASIRPYAAALHGAGLRTILVFAGAPEHELLALASILLTDWSLDPTGDELVAATWGLETPHVHFDVETRVPPRGGIPLGPALAALDLVERPPAAPHRKGSVASELLAELRSWRETALPEPAALGGAPTVTFTVSAEMQAEVAIIRQGVDVAPDEIGAALVEALGADPQSRERVARAILSVAVELTGSSLDVSPLVHRALETVDADLSPHPEARDDIRAAYAQLAAEPLKGRLAAGLPLSDTPELRGPLFSLFSLLADPSAIVSLAEALPRWAVSILADTLLLREQDDAPHRHERVRERLASARPGDLLLGLAMAARLEDPRLTDTLVALGGHRTPEVREGALVALRQHSSPRVKELAVKRLTDDSGAVRVEALRYAVAHKLPELVPILEQRLGDPGLEAAEEAEVRAVCIAYGRVGRDHAEPLLLELATGKRRTSGTLLSRMALHGLRASGSVRARAYLEHVVAEVPRLRDEASAILAEPR